MMDTERHDGKHKNSSNLIKSLDKSTITIHLPQSKSTLKEAALVFYDFVIAQVNIPSRIIIRITGTHLIKLNAVTTAGARVFDFDFWVDISDLLLGSRQDETENQDSLLSSQSRTVIILDKNDALEHVLLKKDDNVSILKAWCLDWAQHIERIGRFYISKKVTESNYNQLRSQIQQLITSLFYRGLVNISFSVLENEVHILTSGPCDGLFNHPWVIWISYFIGISLIVKLFTRYIRKDYHCIEVLWTLRLDLPQSLGVADIEMSVQNQVFDMCSSTIRNAVLGKRTGYVELMQSGDQAIFMRSMQLRNVRRVASSRVTDGGVTVQTVYTKDGWGGNE